MKTSQSPKALIFSLALLVGMFVLPRASHALDPANVFSIADIDKQQALQTSDPNRFIISKNNYGFTQEDQKLYFGYGCVTFDLSTQKLECTLPKSLTYATLSVDGRYIFGCLVDEIPFYLDTKTSITKTPKICFDQSLHGVVAQKNSVAWTLYASVNQRREPIKVQKINIFTGEMKSSEGDRDYNYYNYDFSGDGKYIVLTNPPRLINGATMKWLPIEKEFNYKEQKAGYLTDAVVRSYDVSMVAADYISPANEESDGPNSRMLVILDRKKKIFLWQKSGVTNPIAFSPDNRYLMVKGAVWDWKADKQVANGILGDVGKFSGNGRRLLTRDSKAFYLYSLP